jgi:hypothetical protein
MPGRRLNFNIQLEEIEAMSKRETNEDRKALPKPVALTPEEVQQVAAAAAAALPTSLKPPGTIGITYN